MKVLILAVLIGTALATPWAPAGRIVGGSDVAINEYPYMGVMQQSFMNVWMFSCGGSLITTNAVLSAAHCFMGTAATQWQVRLGSSFTSSGGSVHPVSQIFNHELFDDTTAIADVAVVRLVTNAVLSVSIAPVSIAGPNYNLPTGTPVQSIGWGRLWSGGDLPENLQHVQVNTIDQQLCVDRYAFLRTQPGFSNFFQVNEDMICAGILDIGGQSVCQGDSGGPLTHRTGSRDVVVGVTSWGFNCAHPFYPAVLARVSYYTDWIIANASS